MYLRFLKRGFDLTFALLMIVLLSPLLALVALAIYLDDGVPVLFRQSRVGLDGQLFTILKFRSMSVETPHVPSVARGRVKITRVGKIIRVTNIDELPQLFNILQGSMSVVGPRPCLAEQQELVNLRFESGAINLKPGLTGLAQIHSFDGMSERTVGSWDQSYTRKVSFLSDLKIVLLTFRYCVQRPPIY